MLDVQLQPSRILALLLAGAYLLSLVLVWVIPAMLAMKIGLGLLLIASFLFYLRRDVLLVTENSIRRLRINTDCNFRYQTHNDAWFDAQLLASSVVTPWLIVLRLAPEGHYLPQYAVILPDSADAESLRKLRVLLRWGCADRG